MDNKVRSINEEFARLEEAQRAGVAWRKWGPYLSERQWGTVREDYSEDGNGNALIVRALLNLHLYYGPDFKVECPTGSGAQMNLLEVARFLSVRLARIFMLDKQGRRPVWGGAEKFQTDPHWRDHILFYEYFHGDNGAGLGAGHQTGWTALVARLIQFFAAL